MSPAATLARRRAVVRSTDDRRARAQLAETAAELRGRAQPYLAAGRPDLAAGYLDEAALFDAASAGTLDS